MRRKRTAITMSIPLLIFLATAILAATALLAWSPWISPAYARQRAETAFTTTWQGVMDGCGLNCKGCGAVQTQKVWFGYQVELEYACGMLPEDSARYHKHGTGFVSFMGTVHGFPRP